MITEFKIFENKEDYGVYDIEGYKYYTIGVDDIKKDDFVIISNKENINRIDTVTGVFSHIIVLSDDGSFSNRSPRIHRIIATNDPNLDLPTIETWLMNQDLEKIQYLKKNL